MKKEISIAPENSIILIMDKTIGKIPKNMNSALVASTNSCVAVGTLSSIDGETLIALSDEKTVAESKEPPVFDGMIDTPSKLISVCTVLNEPILELGVEGIHTRIKIWANDPSEPDNINIVVT